VARVLIAGCGWLGGALGKALAARGDAVWGLRRSASLLPDAVQPIEADLDDARSLAALPAALDAVVYAAAPEAADEAAYVRTYVRGLGHVIDAVRGGGRGPRVILLSSTSVYGQTGGEWVDETSATEPGDFRGRVVLRGEEVLRGAALPSLALRLGGLYGPGRTSLIDAVRDGRAGLDPGPARFTNRIHRDDAVGVVLHLLALPESDAAAVYVGVDREPADRNDVVTGWPGDSASASRKSLRPPPPPDACCVATPATSGARARGSSPPATASAIRAIARATPRCSGRRDGRPPVDLDSRRERRPRRQEVWRRRGW
jgi:nucleoside-diphosphate-sugar epimerase